MFYCASVKLFLVSLSSLFCMFDLQGIGALFLFFSLFVCGLQIVSYLTDVLNQILAKF